MTLIATNFRPTTERRPPNATAMAMAMAALPGLERDYGPHTAYGDGAGGIELHFRREDTEILVAFDEAGAMTRTQTDYEVPERFEQQ